MVKAEPAANVEKEKEEWICFTFSFPYPQPNVKHIKQPNSTLFLKSERRKQQKVGLGTSCDVPFRTVAEAMERFLPLTVRTKNGGENKMKKKT